ncbi:putative RNA polymerase sigma E protein [Actinoplanes italicus]|uniref:RNA polymerase sigma-70 factor (ECF subfamily) n=1 Tax=Actinoplanes italicus TaxID=113567 RepID=A0A2T0K8Q7_9ACTN|nr:RNA polymerase sigma factor [Actinoplanes italicus]PRX19431.1 RNA polymerase sigma-70 factor (ECF subfamily) [Actinoplanes italicus]GIE30554.1 putative RNA polymerase sigma E protein [Actinoplanes italicus]
MAADLDQHRLAAARSGDQDAFRELWRDCERTVYGLCVHLTGGHNDALDAMQETQIAVWRNLHRFEQRAPFRSWVLAIARNAARDVVRRRAATPQPLLDDRVEPAFPQPLFADAVDAVLDLRAALAALAPAHREALLLWAGGLTYEQVAVVLEVPVGTVKTWIFRARQRLRGELAGHG